MDKRGCLGGASRSSLCRKVAPLCLGEVVKREVHPCLHRVRLRQRNRRRHRSWLYGPISGRTRSRRLVQLVPERFDLSFECHFERCLLIRGQKYETRNAGGFVCRYEEFCCWALDSQGFLEVGEAEPRCQIRHIRDERVWEFQFFIMCQFLLPVFGVKCTLVSVRVIKQTGAMSNLVTLK